MESQTYSLAWPRELFAWEAKRVLSANLGDDAIRLLVHEAFADSDIEEPFDWTGWLGELLQNPARLIEHVTPVYWGERQGRVGVAFEAGALTFGYEFIQLIDTMQDEGYFPRALPRYCVDDPTDNHDVTRRIRSATKQAIDWPIAPDDAEKLSESALYSLVEYFNDQAQRPRVVVRFHDYGECGNHYGRHSAESGGAVYRWRVNQLLSSHAVDLRLGSTAPERGRLVRHFGTALDDLADSELRSRATDTVDEVAHAIRHYRARGATRPQKRAALALLAGALEPRRKKIGALLGKQDESDLFQIANRFAIRHRNDQQREDFSEEFLDWIFWTYLSTASLMDQLEGRHQLERS